MITARARGSAIAPRQRSVFASRQTGENFATSAKDGEIGHVWISTSMTKPGWFATSSWRLGSWFSIRRVLISPISIQQPNWRERTLPLSITMCAGQGKPAHRHREAGVPATRAAIRRPLRLSMLLGRRGHVGRAVCDGTGLCGLRRGPPEQEEDRTVRRRSKLESRCRLSHSRDRGRNQSRRRLSHRR